jgi:hypothetical protein
MSRDEILLLSNDELLRLCRVDTFRGTGPGGQKRNKTESAVRVTHRESGISAFDDQTRSQHLNRIRALQKLRLELAVNLRQVTRLWEQPCPGLNSRFYPCWLGAVFDALEATGFRLSDAAALLGSSTGKLSRNLARDPFVCQLVNQERQKHALTALRWE